MRKIKDADMARLMVKVEGILIKRFGGVGGELLNYCRQFSRDSLREVYDVPGMSVAERVRYCEAWIDEIDNNLFKVLAVAWETREDMFLYDNFLSMRPWQWRQFKVNLNFFIWYSPGRLVGEVRKVLESVSLEAEAFNEDAVELAAFHAAYMIGDARVAENEWGDRISGFWTSQKTILELMDELGDKRSVFDALLEEQRRIREATCKIGCDAAAAAINSAKTARNLDEEVDRRARIKARQIKGGIEGVKRRDLLQNHKRDRDIVDEVNGRLEKGEKLDCIYAEIGKKVGLKANGVKSVYYRKRRRT